MQHFCIIDRIQRAVDEDRYSCGIFLDFAKAFNTVNHNILLRKLKHFLVGIRELLLIGFSPIC